MKNNEIIRYSCKNCMSLYQQMIKCIACGSTDLKMIKIVNQK